jgi:hypothetical protein
VEPYSQGNILGWKDVKKTKIKLGIPFRKKWKPRLYEENATVTYDVWANDLEKVVVLLEGFRKRQIVGLVMNVVE